VGGDQILKKVFRMSDQSNRSIVFSKDKSLLFPISGLFSLAVIGFLVLVILTSEELIPIQEMYLMPWVFGTGVVIALPSIYLYYKGRFDVFHPLVFAAWSYFFPAFVIGGLVLAGGFTEPYFLAFIDDQHYNLPLTLVYVMLGYAGLTLGFFLPIGRFFGSKVNGWLPVWKWDNYQLLIPGLILLTLGLVNTVFAFFLGLLGFQKVAEIGSYDGIIFLVTLFWMQASFLLWLCIFKTERLNVNQYVVIGILLVTSLLKAAFQGNRGSLFQIFILIAFAFGLSGRTIKFQHRIYAGIIIVLAIVVGMIYGTTFRNIKQTESQVSMDEYTEYIFKTLDRVSEQDLSVTLVNGFSALAERIEAVSSLGVVVANYEKLKPYEESYGLDNNIYKDSVTFFIPRVVWADKPVASEPRKYGDLYFNYGENSFTITPMGDLLRNFGPIGVPLGMILLGILVRLLYSTFVENQAFSYWRTVIYYMLLTSISYESFYGGILPYLIKVGIISVIGVLLIKFLIGKTQKVY
jgi:hypothetical protein